MKALPTPFAKSLMLLFIALFIDFIAPNSRLFFFFTFKSAKIKHTMSEPYLYKPVFKKLTLADDREPSMSIIAYRPTRKIAVLIMIFSG